MKFTLVIIAIIVVGSVLWFTLGGNNDETNTNENTINSTVNESITNTEPTEDSNMVEITDTMENEMAEAEYDYMATLFDVTGGISSGIAKSKYDGGQYMLIANFEDLDEPIGTDFYEGWIVRNTPLDVISTGAVEKKDGIYTNMYISAQDLTDHDFYVLTLEPNDGDPAPADHILEGTLIK